MAWAWGKPLGVVPPAELPGRCSLQHCFRAGSWPLQTQWVAVLHHQQRLSHRKVLQGQNSAVKAPAPKFHAFSKASRPVMNSSTTAWR